MKKLMCLCAALMLTSSLMAMGQSMDILEVLPKGIGGPSTYSWFVVNKATGVAKVKTKVDSSAFDDHDLETSVTEIEGLRYDQESNTVVYEKDGVVTECANWEGKSPFKYTDGFKNTGCKLTNKVVKRKIPVKKFIGKGLKIEKREFVVVTFTVL